MAISLFCYSTAGVTEVEGELASMKDSYPDLFGSAFLISRPHAPNVIEEEIANENFIHASTIFLVSLNDKSRAGAMNAVVRALKTTFGEENIAILFENEQRR